MLLLQLSSQLKEIFVSLFATVAVGMMVVCAGAEEPVAQNSRPNILFLYADDHRWDAMSCVQKEMGEKGRFPWMQTPNLDRLAQEGVRFRNAFVTFSLCAPSRAVFLTGRYNHLNGIASNFRDFPLDNVTHATLLGSAGYHTGYIGKWHMGNQRARPGFDFHASYTGHSTYENPTFVVQGKDVKREGWIDDLSTDYAIDFIQQQKGKSQPWSLAVGFKSPHGPFSPPERAAQRFAGAKGKTVPNLYVSPPYSRRSKERAARIDRVATEVDVNLNYFRCISAIDDCVGRILEELDRAGMSDNTIVIYTSDNGFYLGEHSLGDKRSAYDESLRIPFLVRYPPLTKKLTGKSVDPMVLNVDLVPTLLDLAGEKIPSTMQGLSWKKLLEEGITSEKEAQDRAAWRKSWFYEYFAEKQRNSEVPDITAVRSDTAKLILYPGHDDWTELFDLKSDPYELNNLASPTAQQEDVNRQFLQLMRAEHDRLAKELDYRVPEFVDRPDWWERGSPSVAPGVVLDLNGNIENAMIADQSGFNNRGKSLGVTSIESPMGGKVMRFDGKSFLDFERTESLSPQELALKFQATFRSEAASGVVLARGGALAGYALAVEEGIPVIVVNSGSKQQVLKGTKRIDGQWVTVAGELSLDKKLKLIVDGEVVAQAPLRDWIDRDPNDKLTIGIDQGSPVLAGLGGFVGEIASVRIERLGTP